MFKATLLFVAIAINLPLGVIGWLTQGLVLTGYIGANPVGTKTKNATWNGP